MSAKPEAAKPAEAAPGGAEEAPKGGGIKAWLPLIISVLLMPALAYATTMFLVVPKIQKSISAGGGGKSGDAAHAEEGAHDAAAADAHGGGGGGKEPAAGAAAGKNRNGIPIDKVIVNIAGTMGTRYLMSRFTLVSDKADFKGIIEKNTDQIRDMAMSIMGAKTITDLEKPGARNVIRSEMISAFNSVLGSGVVQEIFFTEFAIQ